jgi:cellulose synthase/poly-beta-1,6-N-acetylglucosamine synthase-like glycosyltransferase
MSYAVWLIASASIIYFIFGYPALLAIRKGRRRPQVAKDPGYEPTVSVILAVYNGGAYLHRKLEGLLGLDYPRGRMEIIVVSDGSSDDTESIAQTYESRGVVLIRARRGGKAAALNQGIARASGEILFFTDVRQPLDTHALRHLVANLADPTVGAVTGELKLLRGDDGEQADMDLYWRYEIWARKRQSEIDSIFNTTGCIYAMRRQLAAPIPEDTLTDDAVLPLGAFFKGYRVIFDPAAIAYDYPALAGTEFRRRFRTLAGLWQVYFRFPRLFTAANRMRWHFLSHKFSRLALPWAILIAFAATLAMPHNWFRTALLLCQIFPVALALLNRVVPNGWLLKRLCSPARTFAVMNLASLSAIAVFFISPARIWKPTQVRCDTSTPAAPGRSE